MPLLEIGNTTSRLVPILAPAQWLWPLKQQSCYIRDPCLSRVGSGCPLLHLFVSCCNIISVFWYQITLQLSVDLIICAICVLIIVVEWNLDLGKNREAQDGEKLRKGKWEHKTGSTRSTKEKDRVCKNVLCPQ